MVQFMLFVGGLQCITASNLYAKKKSRINLESERKVLFVAMSGGGLKMSLRVFNDRKSSIFRVLISYVFLMYCLSHFMPPLLCLLSNYVCMYRIHLESERKALFVALHCESRALLHFHIPES